MIYLARSKDIKKTLGYARSKVDFVVGFDLYMMPSNMDLYIGKINGYYNLLVDASESDNPLVLGHNGEVNDLPAIPVDVEVEDLVNNSEDIKPTVNNSEDIPPPP